VQAPVPAKTVYVVLEVGLTITVLKGFGFKPTLAVQLNGPEPLQVRFEVCPLQITELELIIVTVNAGAIETVATACAVHAPVPDKTVYVVFTMGATITEEELPGLAPELAVQVYGPIPEVARFVFAPKQIIVLEGVIEIGNVGAIETVAIAVVVHAPVPDKTVYVVVEFGVTVIFAALAGLLPELAVHTKGPDPLADKEVLAPKHMVVFDGVMAIAGIIPIETVATA
jgi:hypothetical protein